MTSTVFSHHALLSDGWASSVRITISHGSISGIEKGAVSSEGDVVVDFLTPAPGNLHSHAFQRAFSGLTERRGNPVDTFWTWREIMYRCALTIQPDELEVVAAQLYMEMLEAGFTRVGEFHYLHHDTDGRPYGNLAEMAERLIGASVQAGISMTMLPCFYAHGNFGGADPVAGQARFVNSLDSYASLIELTKNAISTVDGGEVGYAPHSLRAVSSEELAAVVGMGSGPIHMHVSEQMKEVSDCISWSGQRPIEWLMANADVDDRWCLIHATHQTEEELAMVLKSGAVVGLCPLTEGNLGDGVFAGQTHIGKGGAFGIGSDSNIRISLAQELSQLEYSQRLQLQNRNVLAGGEGSTGENLFCRAVAGSGQALNGSPALAIGNEASMISFNGKAAPWVNRGTLLDSWIFGMDQGPDRVWARGKVVVAEGRHTDRDRISASFQKVMKTIVARF
ncbi:formimidoylglutamate deiminase [Paracoccus sp. SM22M-07]|uniref:formimidoylglutamate deiminase n=1 Tax=Paracoccus sp. SM22M-07 TaxID=1520813 RepID=UPI0009234BB9|nr:formimidoylglutamate deiminase [Paracoccus sp. SM22M-07]OJH43081.1 N-formimino-L-glutamate deiminase [Paracoccus sp. SM22M-07]